MSDTNSRRNGVQGIQELFMLSLQLFNKFKMFTEIKVYFTRASESDLNLNVTSAIFQLNDFSYSLFILFIHIY